MAKNSYCEGLYRDSNLIILDEPTAAMNPMEETRLYLDFAGICEKKKTALIVTHRLASRTDCG